MSNPLYTTIFHVASVLEIPVVVAAVVSLALVVVEVGRLVVEVAMRSRRRPGLSRTRDLERAAGAARAALRSDERPRALSVLAPLAWSSPMARAYEAIVAHHGSDAQANNNIAKDLADFDLSCQRRLARTRLLVRIGPALGLMGTLIPLTPALDGLAKGNVRALTDNLRVAFSVTVLGLFVGAVAFGLSLIRDNLYGQDYSDLEYVAAILTDESTPAAAIEPPS
ncbi:MotA/TolQ/ExbB proton channel family protein [uncultured Jatrophihabitans sp.]|uniref:MotA/TolQ/ExbB proton channel family protein n=1 Tax=uncultured Jatrophihabitans sp. TaxID=1610747 RepID=UPI0035CB2ECF